MRLFACLLVAIAITTPAGGQAAGTYRLTICARPCTDADSGLVSGHLVLFASEIKPDTLPDAQRTALAGQRNWWLLRTESLNACFALPNGPSHALGQELYAGITRRSLTQWRRTATGYSVPLYRSPDAAYTLVGEFESDRFVGQGHQGNCCGGEPPVTYFLARRVKEPDINSCM